jgi:arginyl-tRNA--protein-N-Asp/Glu arginylyltransferase
MGLFSGKPKIQGDELDKCLVCLEEALKLMIFRRSEEALFKSALVEYGALVSTDNQAVQEIRQMARRLVLVASEILRRNGEMAPIPTAVSAVHAAWQKAYLAYSEYVKAEFAVWEAVANSMKPDFKRLRRFFSQSEDLRHKALREQEKFARRLKIDRDVTDKLLTDVSAAVAAENWQPKHSERELDKLLR